MHWLRFSIALTADLPLAKVLATIGGGWSDGLPGGGFNQPRHMIHESGARLYYGSPREDQPVVLECSGEVCETHAEFFVAIGVKLDARCTRFDVAADIGPDDETKSRWNECRRAFRGGRCDTRIPARSFTQTQSDRPGEGWTAYYGARTSEAFLRVYTRRGPLRMEWEIKPTSAKARAAATHMLSEFTPAEIWRAYARRCVFPSKWFGSVIDGDAAKVEPVKESRCALGELLEYVRKQIGPTLWICKRLGLSIEDLERAQTMPDGLWLSEMKRYASEAKTLGLDGSRLLADSVVLAARRLKGGAHA